VDEQPEPGLPLSSGPRSHCSSGYCTIPGGLELAVADE
jgi:hypothetical protein